MIDLAARRRLGTTEVLVGPLAFGGNALSNLYDVVDEAQAIDAVVASYEHGVRYFDTAPLYGYGLGEHRLGTALRRFPRDSYVLSTKVGRLLKPHGPVPPPKLAPSQGGIFAAELPFEPVFDYSYDGVLRSVEDSLQRLGTNRLDIALIHDADHWTHGAAYETRLNDVRHGALPALQRLKGEGVVRAFGAGVNEIAACERLLETVDLDCLMVAGRYTLLERDGVDEFLQRCLERRVSILAAAPFNSGILATGVTPQARYNYLPPPPEVKVRVMTLEETCAAFGVTLAAAALQFPLQHPAVATVVAGCRSRAEAERSIVLVSEPIPPDFWHAVGTSGSGTSAAAVDVAS